jgi:hypothetical protein
MMVKFMDSLNCLGMTASFLIPALRANDLKSVTVVDRNVVTQGMAKSDMAALKLKFFAFELFQQLPEFIRVLIDFFLLFSHDHLLSSGVLTLSA